MMKKNTKPLITTDVLSKIFLCSLFAITLFFQSCNLLTNNDDYLENAVDIELLSEAKSLTKTTSEAARTASVIPPENIFYTVEAYLVDENGIKIANTDSVFETEPFEGVKLTYRLLLSTGNWRFKITGYKDIERTIPILYGESTKNTICNGGRYYETINVYFTKTNSGSANLEIDVSKVTINKLKVSGTKSPLDGIYERNDDNKIIIFKENIPSGSYDAKLDFYTNTALLYSTQEIINIRDNLETYNWIYSGNSQYLFPIENSTYSLAKFVLTPKLIIQDKNPFCYVQSPDAQSNLTASVAPSDDNSGSFIAPYKTLQAAFDRTYALNKEFNAAGKTERDFIIYINGKIDSNIIDSTNEKLAEITTDEPFNLSIKPSDSALSKTINGNISIGKNINTTISDITLDGLSSESFLDIARCTFSGKGKIEIKNTNANIINTKIGSQSGEITTSNAINFTDSKIFINNSKDYPFYATDFQINHCEFELKTPSANDTIPIKTSTFTLNNCENPSFSYANISTDNDFTISSCNGINFSNITIVGKNIEIDNQNTSNSESNNFKNCKFTAENENFKNSNLNFNTSSISGIVNITDSDVKISGKISSSQTIFGDALSIENSTFELKEKATISSNQSINIKNSSFLSDNSTISSKNAELNIENSKSNFNYSTITASSLSVKTDETSTPDEKPFNSENSSFEITNQLTFKNSDVDFNNSQISGVILVEKDNLLLLNSTLNGNIGQKASEGIDCDGIDTDSTVIFSGKTYVKPTTKKPIYEGKVYLEKNALLYVQNVPTVAEITQDSIETIANITALYPAKNDVVLTLLNENKEPQSFDNTFYVDESTTEEIDKRYLLDTAGYYLDYDISIDGSNLRKGIIKESSIDINLPVVGGYNIEIADNDKINIEEFDSEPGKYYYSISKDDFANTPIKAIITRFGEPVEQPDITYKLYRESTNIATGTSAANQNGFIIPDANDRIIEELKYTDKLTYILQIIFTDNETNLKYADSVTIVIKN